MKNSKVLHVSDFQKGFFEEQRKKIEVVCVGDSITGWNNYSPTNSWPLSTYPQFLAELTDLKIANLGIAGEYSRNGLKHTDKGLELFPNASYFVIGFGTNDLGTLEPIEGISARIIKNLGEVVEAIKSQGKRPFLFNVPYLNESLFDQDVAREFHEKRDYHNAHLVEYCRRQQIPLADICSALKDEHFADGLHPNEQGARIIAEEVYKLIR